MDHLQGLGKYLGKRHIWEGDVLVVNGRTWKNSKRVGTEIPSSIIR